MSLSHARKLIQILACTLLLAQTAVSSILVLPSLADAPASPASTQVLPGISMAPSWTMAYSLGRVNDIAVSPDGLYALLGTEGFAALLDLETWTIERRFLGHQSAVTSVAFAPNGECIYTGSVDGLVRVWDAQTGALLRLLDGHGGAVLNLAFSSDGTRLLSVDKAAVLLWNAESGELARVIYAPGGGNEVRDADVSVSGDLILTSASYEGVILWDAHTGEQIRVLTSDRYTGAVALSHDGTTAYGGQRLWDISTGELLHTLSGVRVAAFSPDDSIIVTGFQPGAKVYDVQSGELLHTLEHSTAVPALAFCPDGAHVLTGTAYRDSAMRLWDVGSGELVRTYAHHRDGVWAISLSPDERRLLTAGRDKTARLWDVASGEELLSVEHPGTVESVAFAAGGTQFLTGCADYLTRLWRADDGALLRTFEGTMLDLSNDGTRILARTRDEAAQLWDLATGDKLQALAGDTYLVRATFSPDDRWVAAQGSNPTVYVWDVQSGQIAHRLSSGLYGAELAFSPDGRWLGVAGSVYGGVSKYYPSKMQLWDTRSWTLAREFQIFANMDRASAVSALRFSADGSKILCGLWEKDMCQLWDLRSGQLLRTFEVPYFVQEAELSADARRVWVAGEDGVVKLWDLDVPAMPLETKLGAERHSNTVRTAAFSADGQWILSGSRDGTAIIWNRATGGVERVLRGHTDEVSIVAFSPDSRWAATGSLDGTVRIWDVGSGGCTRALLGHTKAVYGVAFLPDGDTLLSASADATCRLWDLRTGGSLRVYGGHTGAINSLALSDDGSRALTASTDTTARLWDLASGETIRVFEHSSAVRQADLSPDGSLAATASGYYARVWDVASGAAIRSVGEHGLDAHTAVFSPEGAYWLVLRGNRAEMREVLGTQLLFHVGSWARGAAYAPGGEIFALTSVGSYPALYDARTGAAVPLLVPQQGWVRSLVWSPDSTQVLAGGSFDLAAIWDAQGGYLVRAFHGHAADVTSVAYSRDGSRIITAAEKTVRLWDARTGELLLALEHPAWVGSAALSPDGSLILTGCYYEDNNARLWDAVTGDLLHTFAVDGATSARAAFSPDGSRILIISDAEGQEITLWDATTLEILHAWTSSHGVSSAIFSPDGARLLGYRSKIAWIMEADTGRILHAFYHAALVRGAVYAPDGEKIVTVAGSVPKSGADPIYTGAGATIYVWDANSGALHYATAYTSETYALSFAPNGQRLASGGQDATIQVWDLSGSPFRHRGFLPALYGSPSAP